MQDFDDASAVTMNTYEQIASVYAERHKFANAPDFWRERLQRFASALRASPAYQVNPSLPVLDMGCGHGRDSLFLAQMRFDVLAAVIDITTAIDTRFSDLRRWLGALATKG